MKDPVTFRDLYQAYPDSDVLSITPPTEKTTYEEFEKEAESAGDTLFLFLLRDIFSPSDPCEPKHAVIRLISAIEDIEAVLEEIRYLKTQRS